MRPKRCSSYLPWGPSYRGRSRKKIRGLSLGRSRWGTRCLSSRAPGRAQQPCATLHQVVGPRGGSYGLPSGRTVKNKTPSWLRLPRARHLDSHNDMSHTVRLREVWSPLGPERCSSYLPHFHLPAPDRATFTQQGVVPHPPLLKLKEMGCGLRGECSHEGASSDHPYYSLISSSFRQLCQLLMKFLILMTTRLLVP
jgi:hypothetical protein